MPIIMLGMGGTGGRLNPIGIPIPDCIPIGVCIMGLNICCDVVTFPIFICETRGLNIGLPIFMFMYIESGDMPGVVDGGFMPMACIC